MEEKEYKIKTLLNKWIKSLIDLSPDISLIYSDFGMDNGLNLTDSLVYEQLQYKTLSSSYDLNQNFSIIIDSIFEENGKNLVFYTIKNSYQIPIFKWYLSLIYRNNEYYIIGNNYISQIVHKFKIHYDLETNTFLKTGINLAIKVEQGYEIKNIFNKHLEYLGLIKPSSYKEDNFLLASFVSLKDYSHLDDITFKIIYSKLDHNIIETRKFPFKSIFNPPFFISNNNLIIDDSLYPYHLYYIDIDNNEHNLYNPRNITIPINSFIKLVVTDSIDNDWIIER